MASYSPVAHNIDNQNSGQDAKGLDP